MASNSIILKNGVALVHDANVHIVPTRTDILIQDGKIAKLQPGIESVGDVEVIDCTHKIISPGFIDTHHHGWQTQLKGRHANQILLQYMITMFVQQPNYGAKDVFYGQLAGMIEALAAGTTTIVDHAHINYTPDHAKLGIAATASSGIRAVYCYTPTPRLEATTPLTFEQDPLPDWTMQTFSELADQAPFGEGRVTLGFAWDSWFLPQKTIQSVFAMVHEKGIRTVTAHGGPFFRLTPIVKAYALLDKRFIISHGGNITQEDADMIQQAGAHVSATPSTELQAAMGRPLCFDASFPGDDAAGTRVGVQACASLGVDCHSNSAGSIISEARLGLQNARNHFNEHHMKSGNFPRALPPSLSVEAAFNLATIKGAETARMETEIGRISEGYKADLVVFDALSPAMVGAAQHDPVAAVIMHSSPADIEMVLVDGVVRKKEGKVLPVSLDTTARQVVGAETIEWEKIAIEVLSSRERMPESLDKEEFDAAVGVLMKMWHIDESTVVG